MKPPTHDLDGGMPQRKRSHRPRTYLAHVVPGLEDVAREELLSHFPGLTVLRVLQRFDERTSVIVFRFDGAPRDLLGLGTVEDVFALAAQMETVPSDWRGIAAIRACISEEKTLEDAVALVSQARPRRRGKITFRVIARKSGRHAFRRVDVQRAAERGVLERFPGWRLVEDDAQIELWVHLVGALLVVGARLSDAALRQRTYRRVSLPAALKPTVARAMVLVSEPRADDTFLDPMCGSGTILIERALAARYRLLLGGDVDPEALQAATENVGPRYKPIELRLWDARDLPLEDGSVSAIVTNMPFGKQIGTAKDNQELYPALLGEWTRILRSGGRMVLLSSERSLIRRALGAHRELALEREIPLLVRGLPAAIHVIRRS
jgi:tRNA (guanine6-N2)-methyltransferase